CISSRVLSSIATTDYPDLLSFPTRRSTDHTVTAHLSNNGIEFRANGSQLKFKGFMKVYVEGVDNKKQEDEVYLPELKEGEKVSAKDIKPNQHFTQPPPRYTEATLVGVLEK